MTPRDGRTRIAPRIETPSRDPLAPLKKRHHADLVVAPSVDDSVAVCEGRLIAWIPGRLRNPLNGAHGHWAPRARERKDWRIRTQLCCQDAMHRSRWKYSPLVGARVVFTAYVWNRYDEDGLAAALKPVLDGLVDARLLKTDGPDGRHRIERRQAIERKHRGVEVVVQIT